jgi:uncharacterized protein (DUF362 family)/NAD-dependent dihydropyrimidine dehydrogenase PreA subunit
VGDSPGLQKSGFSGKICGLGEVTRRLGAEWVDFTRDRIDAPCPRGKIVKQFPLTAAFREAECIISLPKLKTHQLMFFTGAMKNLFGMIPSILQSPYHVRFPSREAFAAMIVDLNMAVMADYAFMDAVVGMEGPGPSAGYPRQMGLILAASNLLALDAAACEIIGYPPREIPVSREALSRGVWLRDFSDIAYPALKPVEIAIPDFIKIPLKRTGSQLLEFILPRSFRKFRERLSPRPVIDRTICIRCGDCTRICGSGAMTLRGDGEERHVEINRGSCISCYCCHEICPVKAIAIESPLKTALFKPQKEGQAG